MASTRSDTDFAIGLLSAGRDRLERKVPDRHGDVPEPRFFPIILPNPPDSNKIPFVGKIVNCQQENGMV